MGISASELCQHVIRPTLHQLDALTPASETLLLVAAQCRGSHAGSLADGQQLGPWGCSREQHRLLWDDFLARDAELASRVRGLASQHAFLADPELELCVNLRYACAIAWMSVIAQAGVPPANADLPSLARLWRQCLAPRGRLRSFYLHANRLALQATAA